LVVLGLSGCLSSSEISRKADTPVEMVCVERNPKVMFDEFLTETVRLIEARGTRVTIVDRVDRATCPASLSYTARWRWTVATYLAVADYSLRDEEGRLVGKASYRAGHWKLDKFGSTGAKIAPLIEELFPQVVAQAPAPTPSPSPTPTPAVAQALDD
jgi:hypothetical protein